jgi:hypothetical protein
MPRFSRPSFASLLRAASHAATFAGLVGGMLWLVGELLTDRFYLTQFLAWTPTFPVVFALALAWTIAWLLARWSRQRTLARSYGEPPPPPPPPSRHRSRHLLLALLAFSILWTIREYRLHRLALPAQAVNPARSLTVLSWNPNATFMTSFHEIVNARHADVIAVANPPAFAQFPEILATLGEAPDSVRFGRLTLLSRYRVLRWGATDLKIRGSRPYVSRGVEATVIRIDTGQALYAELETTATLGRSIVVWFLDIPSDPLLWRRRMLAQARDALAAPPMIAYVRNQGLDQPDTHAERFPDPDLILGDFNTTRGSFSLSLIAGDATHAFDLAGAGLDGTFPRDMPLVSIDHLFVAPWLDAASFEIIRPDAGTHRMLRAVITPR